MPARLTYLAAALLLGVLLTGCGGSSEGDKKPTAKATTTAPPPSPTQAVPTVGTCYDLDYQAATSATSTAASVPCSDKHTAVTVYVGKIDAVADGHLLTVDSQTVQDQLAATCPTKVGPWVGGTQDQQRLARFSTVWFTPSLADASAGATWYRCDLVAVRTDDALANLKGKAKGVLTSADALGTFGTCGTSAPSAQSFRRVICSEKHSWQAVSVVPIAKDATYLGKAPQTAADDACKVQAQQRASDPLVYKWSFEWPARDDWDKGQRYGLCWVPAS